MTRLTALLAILLSTSLASAGEVLFSAGPQQHADTPYYWLAEWKLEITLPARLAPGDRLEVLFGSKGSDKRTLYFQCGDKGGSVADVREQTFEWVEIPLENLAAGEKVILSGKGREKVAFLAGVRMTGESTLAPNVKPIRVAGPIIDTEGKAVWSTLPGFEATSQAASLWNPSPREPDWSRAERSSQYAGIALDKVQRWLHERCMAVRDEKSGLFRPTGREWNYRDTAADCYPFYIWAAYYTDKTLLDTVMIDALEAEQRLCNHLDRLPVPYDMDTQRKNVTSLDRMIFGSSEYAKDGLIPIVEITGRDYPWFERMQGLVDDIFKHAAVETPYGLIPSTNIEVNGELLQLLPRLHAMTGDRKYLDWAHRLADYYLLAGDFVPEYLSDHGCEILGGLGLLFAVDSTECPEKAAEYRPHLQNMFDQILRRGTNSDGVIIRYLQDDDGPHDDVTIGDGWGYDFVGFLDHDMATKSQRYQEAIRRAMTNLLKPRYFQFSWDHGSRDNIADSVEGGLYLLYRIPVTEGFVWADREIATVLVDHTDPDRLWGTHKLEANTVRTVLIHTMLHTRNVIARPWIQGLQLGAAPVGDGICLFLKSDEAYEGTLVFDIPRHRLHMGLREDWPRMNAVPEWFTVEPDDEHAYTVADVDASTSQVFTGASLRAGLRVRLEAGKPLRLTIQPL